MKIKIGIIGDYDGRPSHTATNEAIRHCTLHLGLNQETQWISTDSLDNDIESKLSGFDALWCAPGSPYKSAQGAMNAIQFARENDYPFIGTCGGFQHAVLEFARDVLDLHEVMRADFDPYAPNPFISALSCSLIGETRNILLTHGTKVQEVYGEHNTEERYNCSFGLNDQFRDQIAAHGFVISGTDENGDTRILELPQNKFFIATLFQPQLSSTIENPHKLILAYLKSAEKFSKRRNAENFTGKAKDYAKGRPGYPDAAFETIFKLAPSSAVFADIGAGTGKFTVKLAERGYSVYAVEPNADMRGQLAITLAPFPNVKIMDGTAEATALPDHSVDILTVAHALHWFNLDAFRKEFHRVVKPGGLVIAIYNLTSGGEMISFSKKTVDAFFTNPTTWEFQY